MMSLVTLLVVVMIILETQFYEEDIEIRSQSSLHGVSTVLGFLACYLISLAHLVIIYGLHFGSANHLLILLLHVSVCCLRGWAPES